MQSNNIDIAYFGKEVKPNWALGATTKLHDTVEEIKQYIDKIIAGNETGWILFWDYSLGEPDTELLQQLIQKPIDLWHAGIKMGLSGLPNALNYINPTWMYNKDAGIDVEHSSFRLSIRCCLIKKEVLRNVGNVLGSYESTEAYGLALGYKFIKSGCVIRYHPQLVNKVFASKNISAKDEWTYIHEFFGMK
jgi:hypothetical protein